MPDAAISEAQPDRVLHVEAIGPFLSKLNRRRLENILIYARAWNTGSVDDRTASQVAKEAISVEQDEAKLLKKTFRQACQVVSTAQAARYLQLEAKTRAEIRYAEAESVPLVN